MGATADFLEVMNGCERLFLYIGVLFVLIIRGLLFGVYIRAANFGNSQITTSNILRSVGGI